MFTRPYNTFRSFLIERNRLAVLYIMSGPNVLETTGDYFFENEISRNPYHLATWLSYLKSKLTSKPSTRYLIYERALSFLPRSFKLWFAYISELSSRLGGKLITDKRYVHLVNIFERSLIHMHKMPVIWCV